jgi:hypothetical protein
MTDPAPYTDQQLERRLAALARADRDAAPPDLEDALLRAALPRDRRPSVLIRLAPLLAAAAAVAIAIPLILQRGAPLAAPEAALVEYEFETALDDDWLPSAELNDIDAELSLLASELDRPFTLTDDDLFLIGDDS